MQSRSIRLIGVVFSNGAMLTVSDKYDSAHCTWQGSHASLKVLEFFYPKF